MEAYKLDDEFFHYWSKLNVVQKESLLNIVKDLAEINNEFQFSGEELAQIKEEREKHFNGTSKSYTWQEVKDMAKNKEKRNGLRSWNKRKARNEIIEAYDYYESARLGSGDDFLKVLENCFQKILQNPEANSYLKNQSGK